MKRLLFTLFAVCAAVFTAVAQTPGYAIFGDVPYGYTDLTANVSTAPQGSVTFSENVLTGSGLPGRINETSNFLRMSLNEATSTSLSENFALHIVLKKKAGATNKVQVSLCNNGWNAARISWEIENSAISDESFTNIALNYSARNTGNWNSYGETNIVGNKTLTSEILRICAANGEQFEITQIYLKVNESEPDPVAPVAGDKDAPTGLTLAASNIQDKSVTLTASATDDNSPISYIFYYKAESDADFTAVAGAVNAASSADAVKVVTGLTPETNYSFKVVASDPSSNSSDYSISGITTLALVERRYYFFRGDPASVSLPSTGVISYDLREGVGSTVGNGGGFTHSQKKYYTAFVNGGSGWWSFNQNLSSAKDMSEISQADWYLVVKFRTTITYGNFNIRLNNAVSYLNGQNLTYESDGSWNVLTLALADAKNTLNYSALQTGTVFQFHADGGTGYLDIAYAYLTNNAASVDDFVDNVAPVISSMSDGDKTTSSVVLTVTASDDSGEDITYIVKEGTAVLTSTPATGASGTATAITVSELVGQNHTLTVIARDGAGNKVSKNINVGLLDADTPPHDLVVTTTHDDRSVTFTMTAEDNNSALTYAILDGEDNVLEDNIVGISGEAKVYKLTGLTPETNYSFKVRVTDNGSNSITSDAINITTDAFVAHRFYLLRGDNSDVPSAADLSSTLVTCNVEYGGNSSRDTRAEDYISVKTNNNWMAVTLKPTATIANEINDDWYIVARFRSNLSNNVFGFNNFRLNLSNNAENWYINNSDGDKPFGRDYNDRNWIVIKKKIGDRRAGSAVPASYLQAGEVAAQLHVNANLIAGEFLDIDYIYFTDDVTNVDEGTQFNKRIALKDAEDNASVLSANNGQTVDIDLTRSLTNASYNTLCLPFDLSSEQVEATFGAGTSIGQLTSARIKENDELYLNFSFVNTMEAGVPYIIQPENNVANPLIENVTIDNTLRPADFEHVAFKGVFSPKEIEVQSADSYSILLLGANNTLSWPNTTANMKGMRAYFDLSTQASMIVRRASFGFHQEGQATGIEEIPSQQQSAKILRNGQLYIIRNGEEYTITGARVK